MKNTKKWFTAAAVVALSSTLAFAGPHGGGKGGKRGGRGGEFGAHFAQKLNLSEAQKQQIKDIQTQFRAENKAFFESARDTRRQIREATEAGDTARATQLKATAQSQHARMKELRDAKRQRIEAVLTPDQRAQWQALQAEREAKRGQRGDRKRNSF
ncbi:MAG TPA: Spy/CpxP family protein refolding chaperone [Thermoanaerobaculia bacterium]|nr:Spy/CpxP family protein refolding chaperone [Thermoanaerobaculia bacterium]